MDITELIIERAVEILQNALIDDIDPDDTARGDMVRAGLMQEDPTKKELHALVHQGDPQKPDSYMAHVPQMSELFAKSEGMDFPAEEIGGGVFEEQTFTVDIGCFLLGKGNRVQAAQLSRLFFARAKKALQDACRVGGSSGLLGLTDEFGRQTIRGRITEHRMNEGGGPPNQFIWRGHIRFAVLTIDE